ncbi:uncharacterized protein LOC127853365 isoform X6 [Dreissena polymorpha]|uniref:uncharacterized protein LOC127853365 isoform X5 n=2 Tax=Dreissena polymorpha TaxID=45954 RepID=UPI0022647073|nr:uncharacterized protein LOC127853365 isoform X5 [Dreissena polymorpha]XP_052243802.1 uncharacterized protein LOC127853365 isoform X6 [Dreissena polymorpha]
MSWRGSNSHLDANVPDYQKMLQGRAPASGWSSTQPSLPSYSSRFPAASSGSYLHARNQSGLARTGSHPGYSTTYQPGKYGVPVESSGYNATSLSNYRSLAPDENSHWSENVYNDKTYGYVGREFDLEPYRSAAHRVTDYASDSGQRSHSTKRVDYSSDSGRNHIGRPSISDYSSDSGMNPRHQRQRSSDFELEIPSPDTSRSQSRSHNEDIFSSPVKSSIQAADFERFNNNQASFDDDEQPGQLQHNHYRKISQSEPNLDSHNEAKRNGNKAERRSDGHSDDQDSGPDREMGKQNSDTFRENFTSPPLYHGNVADLTLVQHGKMLRGKPSNLTSWQQEQRSPPSPRDLDLHTRLSLKPGLVHRPYSQDKKAFRDREFSSDNNTDSDLLRQNDTDSHRRVESQLRETVLELEELVKEYETKLRQRSHGTETGATFTQMQELEFRNAELRTELAKMKHQKQAEIEELEIKLGGVEHEVVQLKTALRKTQPATEDLREQLMKKDSELSQWQEKHSAAQSQYEAVRDKVAGMERYLADLPTLEEFTKNAEDISTCTEELESKRSQVADLEQRLEETTETLADRETTIMELENKQRQLAGKMHELSTEIRRIKTEGEGRALARAQEELAEVREVKDKVTQDLDKAKKLLEVNHRRVRQLETKHTAEVRQLQERLGQEEEAVVALREEARLKDEQVNKLKKSLKEVRAGQQTQEVSQGGKGWSTNSRSLSKR